MKDAKGRRHRTSGRWRYVGTVVVAVCLAGPSRETLGAAGFEESARVLVGGDEDDQFSLAAAGHRVVLGNTGLREARVYDARTGVLEAILECPAVDPEGGREACGRRAAMTRRRIALGSRSVFVFDRRGRVVTRIDLPAPESVASLDLRGNRLVVGSGSGRVYLHHAGTGALLREFADPDAAPDERFDLERGFGKAAVRIDETLVVGAPGCSFDPGCPPGEALAFDVEDGTLLWRTRAPTPQPSDGFASRLARLGRDVVVGSRTLPAVHRVDGRTGALEATYTVPGLGHALSGALAARGDTVVVGDTRVGGDSGGAVHLFSARTGGYRGTVTPLPPLSCGALGSEVALTRRHLLVTTDAYCGSGMLLLYRPVRD